MFKQIDEPIEVFVNFTTGGPQPIAFSWRGKDYDVNSINFTHTSKLGNTKQFHFSVSTKTEAYKITLDSQNLNWTLNEVYENPKIIRQKGQRDQSYFTY